MTHKVTITAILATCTIVLALVLTPVVLAEEANEVEVQTETTSSESFYEQKQQRLEALKTEAEKKREEAKKRAELQVETAKKNAEAKKEEVRIKNCEARISALENKISATSEAARRHLDKIDWFNDKIEAYVTKAGLSVPISKAVVDTAGAAEAAVLNLESVDTANIDCSNIDVATQAVIEYKDLLSQAKSALTAYRKATKDYLVAVKTASESAESDGSSTEAENTQEDNSSATEGTN